MTNPDVTFPGDINEKQRFCQDSRHPPLPFRPGLVAKIIGSCVRESSMPAGMVGHAFGRSAIDTLRRYFQELCARSAVPSAIVLDNYQDISPSSPFHELMVEGLSVIPEGIITVLVLSRNEPPPVFTRQDAAERFAFLGWNDLRFSFEEASQFAVIHVQEISTASREQDAGAGQSLRRPLLRRY